MDARNIATQRPSKKSDWKHIELYKILEVISKWAYGLQLPKDINVHLIQSITRLSIAADNHIHEQAIKSPPQQKILNGAEKYGVEKVKDSRQFRKQLQYLVKW
jgi:hypothetical protein